MPMAMATCWLSATARMATPMRLLRKNHVKMPRKAKVTTTPRTWIGGMEAGPIENGVSPMPSDSARVSPPTVMGSQHDALQPEAEDDHDRQRRNDAAHDGHAFDGEDESRNEARQHHELALGEVDGVGGLVDQHEAQRDQRVHEPDRQAADGECER